MAANSRRRPTAFLELDIDEGVVQLDGFVRRQQAGHADAHRSTACAKAQELWGYDVYAATPDDNEGVAL